MHWWAVLVVAAFRRHDASRRISRDEHWDAKLRVEMDFEASTGADLCCVVDETHVILRIDQPLKPGTQPGDEMDIR